MPFVSPSVPTFLDGNMEKAEVTELYPWMEYQFRIIATNEHGSGEASIPSLKIKTWDACKERTLIAVIYCILLRTGVGLKKMFLFFSAPVVSPMDVAGYGGRNGEIIITWTVSIGPQFMRLCCAPKILAHIPALTKSERCFFFPFLFQLLTP